MKLGELVRAYREEHKLSQRAFAEICGVSNGYISLIERDEIDKRTGKPSKPKVDSLMAIAKGMGMSLQNLIDTVDVDIPVTIKRAATKGDGIDEELIYLFSLLTPEEKAMLRAQIKGILASRKQ